MEGVNFLSLFFFHNLSWGLAVLAARLNHFSCLFVFFLVTCLSLSLSLNQVMGTHDQWVSFGPVNTGGAWSQLLIDSTISSSPPSVWHSFCHLRVSEGRTSLRDSTPPHHTLPSQTPPTHYLTLTSPRGREQQPPWCCHRDKEMNCECLNVDIWMCTLITYANKNSYVDQHTYIAQEEFFHLSVRTCRPFSNTSKFDHMAKTYIMFSSLNRKLFELNHPEEVNADVVWKCIYKNV